MNKTDKPAEKLISYKGEWKNPIFPPIFKVFIY